MIILIAGYDTTGNTLSFAMYELAKNHEIQDRLRAEVEDITDGDTEKKLNYDDLQNMTYLDQILSETLRFHNVVGNLMRVTTKEYTIPGTDIILPEDSMVWINAVGLHFDAKHYSDPHTFNPEHFSKEAKGKRNP